MGAEIKPWNTFEGSFGLYKAALIDVLPVI